MQKQKANMFNRENDMKIRLPLLDRVFFNLRGRINDRNFMLNRNKSYEIELTPPPMKAASTKARLQKANAVKFIGAPAPVINNIRPWLVSRSKAEEIKQTPSNLG
jgi:hypothetical protein